MLFRLLILMLNLIIVTLHILVLLLFNLKKIEIFNALSGYKKIRFT